MPFRDRTGSWGRGSGTGFGLGFCGGYSPLPPYQYSQQIVPQLTTSSPYSYAPGFGSMMQIQNPYYNSQFGRGMRQGFGLGMGFGLEVWCGRRDSCFYKYVESEFLRLMK